MNKSEMLKILVNKLVLWPSEPPFTLTGPVPPFSLTGTGWKLYKEPPTVNGMYDDDRKFYFSNGKEEIWKNEWVTVKKPVEPSNRVFKPCGTEQVEEKEARWKIGDKCSLGIIRFIHLSNYQVVIEDPRGTIIICNMDKLVEVKPLPLERLIVNDLTELGLLKHEENKLAIKVVKHFLEKGIYQCQK